MNNRKSVSWMLFLCVTTSPLAGCDGADAENAALLPDDAVLELGQAEIGMWPIVEHGSESPAEFAPPAVPEAVPVQADLPYMNLSPSEDLVIGWLRWALEQPYYTGPVADTTGEDCGLGQSGPVWFLAGTFGGEVTRECDIPAGKQLFLPLVNRWCVFPDEYYTSDEQIEETLPFIEAWYDAKHAATCELTLRIDGQDVRPDFESLDEATYIKVMDTFELDLDEEHWAPAYFEGGLMPATGDGNYALIQPLAPGDHVIELAGTVCGTYPFHTAATYLLHVGP
jgi:hypothetical protein